MSVPVPGSATPGALTPAQQDRVVDECFQCRLCRANCPYVPGMHELAIDFPRLMARARRCATPPASARSERSWPINSSVAPTSFGKAGDPGRAGRSIGGRCRGRHASSPAAGPRHRCHRAAAPGAVRPATLLDARCGADRTERTRPGSASHDVPDVSRRVPATRDRPRPRRRLRPPWHRVRRRSCRMLRRAMADGGRHPHGSQRTRRATSQRSPPRFAAAPTSSSPSRPATR